MILKSLPKWIIVSASAFLGLIVFCVGIYGYYSVSFKNKILPNVLVAGVSLEGLTINEAREELKNLTDEFSTKSLAFSIDGENTEIKIKDLNPDFNINEAVFKAYGIGRSGRLLPDILERIEAVFRKRNFDEFTSINSNALANTLDALSKKYDQPEKNAGIKVTSGNITIIPEKDGQRFERVKVESLIWHSIKTLSYAPLGDFPLNRSQAAVTKGQVEALKPQVERTIAESLSLKHEDESFEISPEQIGAWLDFLPGDSTLGIAKLGVKKELIEAYAKTLAEQIFIEPKDAKLKIEDGKAVIFEVSQDGLELDIAKTTDLISEGILSRTVLGIKSNDPNGQQSTIITLPVATKKANITDETIETLGIKELIGRAETDFSGSPRNRVHNITTGTKFINGLLIRPGDEFSTVGTLGEVDASSGYLPELVIKNNRTIPEYGGGLCQVSTTLFRSVLNAGLKVTERRNHSYRVSYYERGIGPGLDATIYLPKPDFKFLNDTPGWILIQGTVKGNKLIFELYGTSDGRKSKIDGPYTLSTKAAPAPVYVQSNSVAPGKTVLIEHAHAGATTTAKYSVVDKDGKLLFEQTFDSVYKALPARYLVGPKPAKPAPKPEVKPEPKPEETPTPPAEEEPETPPVEPDEEV